MMSDYAAFVGFDWADKKHDLCLVDATSGKKEFTVIKHTPQDLQEWALSMRTRFGGQRIAVCLEPQPWAFDLCSLEVRLSRPLSD